MKVIQKTVYATFQEEGWHCWPQAPDELSYLRARHRHIFHVRVDCSITESNRQIEFITLKDKARLTFRDLSVTNLGEYTNRSCEMLAEELGFALAEDYNLPVLFVSVSEDGENGGEAYFDVDSK